MRRRRCDGDQNIGNGSNKEPRAGESPFDAEEDHTSNGCFSLTRFTGGVDEKKPPVKKHGGGRRKRIDGVGQEWADQRQSQNSFGSLFAMQEGKKKYQAKEIAGEEHWIDGALLPAGATGLATNQQVPR
jgi:hypothetical protein